MKTLEDKVKKNVTEIEEVKKKRKKNRKENTKKLKMNPEYVLWEQKKGKNFRTEGHKSHNV